MGDPKAIPDTADAKTVYKTMMREQRKITAKAIADKADADAKAIPDKADAKAVYIKAIAEASSGYNGTAEAEFVMNKAKAEAFFVYEKCCMSEQDVTEPWFVRAKTEAVRDKAVAEAKDVVDKAKAIFFILKAIAEASTAEMGPGGTYVSGFFLKKDENAETTALRKVLDEAVSILYKDLAGAYVIYFKAIAEAKFVYDNAITEAEKNKDK